jgi:hypothetical protein
MIKPIVPLALTIASLLASTLTTFAGETAPSKNVVQPIERQDYPVHPITAPYWSEDSFIGTDIRPVFAYHAFPNEIFGGGRATVYALQLRVKILKNLQFVAYKDGYMDIDTKGYKADGWNDIAAGLKFAWLQKDEMQLYSAIGVGYEFASGDDNVLQDDDEVRFWASINKGFGPLHLGAVFNYFIAGGNGSDAFGNSNHLSWHLHADYQACKWFSPVVEINGYHVVDEGNPVTPFSGADVLNLGGNKSEDVVTLGLGAEVRPCRNFAMRAAYELPLTNTDQIFGHRWTFSAVISF